MIPKVHRTSRLSIGPVERRVARRCLIFWFLVRLTVASFLGLLNENAWTPDPLASLIIVGVVFFLCYLTVRANNEDLFLANLGTPVSVVYALCVVPAAAMEIGIGIVAWG